MTSVQDIVDQYEAAVRDLPLTQAIDFAEELISDLEMRLDGLRADQARADK